MQALLKALTRLMLRVLVKPFLGPPFPYAFQRRLLELALRTQRSPGGIRRETIEVGSITIRKSSPESAGAAPAADRPAILYVHGGGFVLGSAAAFDAMTGWIAAETGADVYAPEYRLAPEHPHPAPTDDLFAAWRILLEQGHDPHRVAIAADSAGGALAVETVLQLAEMDVASPAAMVLISPWLDLTLSGASVTMNASRDPLLRRSWLEQSSRAHAGGLRRSDPRISPLYADLSGLPPTLIQVGSDEILLDDSVRFSDRLWAAGVEVELQRFDGWWHEFQASAGLLRTAREAIIDIAGFLDRRLDG
jgi:monoterpene epsilon-lactone hydrolase